MSRLARRIDQALLPLLRLFQAIGHRFGRTWRRSLQLRVVVSTFTLSLVVISVLGLVIINQITGRLLDAKKVATTEELDRARVTVERELSGPGQSPSPTGRLERALAALSSQTADPAASGNAGTFESVLIRHDPTTNADQALGPAHEIPSTLRNFVQRDQVSRQFATVSGHSGTTGPALIVGTPTDSDLQAVELYLIFPLSSEVTTLNLLRSTILIGGAVLLLLLTAISLLVARQVVLPIRSAARIAVRFADGRLDERMAVRGEDDMAKLAMSFNEMAEGLSRQITQLEEFGNLQRRFTSDVSHELRTPLTTVRMAADIIHDSSDDLDPTLKRSAELLVAELDRFEALLGDLLEISRHDAGVAELTSEQLDLRLTVENALATVRHLAVAAETELIVELPPEPIVAEVDPRRVERVLRNLMANAIDHSESKPVLIRLRANQDAAAVIVRDQGVGLRPGEEKLVFNRFWRSDPSRVRRSGGTGLGLAISLEDARLHNGKLEAWGELGRGACFRFTVPLIRGRKLFVSPLPLKPAARDLDFEPQPETR